MRPPAARWRRLALAGIAGLALAASMPGILSAHPLGNFTINHYAGLRVGLTSVALDYVLDMAEIPTFQERQRIDTNADGTVDAAEIEAERLTACARTAPQLALIAAGTTLELRPTAAGLSFPKGSSGLETMRLVCEFTAALPVPLAGLTTITYRDDTWNQRIGWREIVAIGDGTTVTATDAPGSISSDRLTSYPQGLLATPLAMERATLSVAPGGPAAAAFTAPDATLLPGAGTPPPSEPVATSAPSPAPGSSGAVAPVSSAAPPSAGSTSAPVASAPAPKPVVQIGAIPGGVTEQLSDLLEVRDLTPIAILGSLLVAAFLGALHAVSPGHGKTVMAAYLVGSRGSARHALALGVTVTISHTLGVLALALVTLFASNIIPPERLYPILGLASGGLVVGIGLWLLRGRWQIWSRTRADARRHDSLAQDHDHPHGTGHSHELEGASARGGIRVAPTGRPALVYGMAHATAPGFVAPTGASGVSHGRERTPVPGEHSHGGVRHSHLPPSGADLTWRSLFTLGLAGGLVPSASALLLLLGSLAANRPAYGIVLVLAFGMGMAIVLGGVGLLLVYATRFVERVPTGKMGRRVWDLLPVGTAIVVIGAGIYLTSQAVTQVF